MIIWQPRYVRLSHRWGLFMCLLHCQFTPKRDCKESFSWSHTGQMQGEETGSHAAVFKSNSHLRVKNDDVVHLEKGDSQFGTIRWMFTVPPPSPLTPQTPSMMNHSELTQKPVWWNACGWEWPKVGGAAQRWVMGGYYRWFFLLFLCLYLPCILLKVFKALNPSCRKTAARWKRFFLLAPSKVMLAGTSDGKSALKERGHANKAYIHSPYTECMLVSMWNC